MLAILDAHFCVSVKRKFEMPTYTIYWKGNIVVFTPFLSCFLLLIILYKLCRKVFSLYFTCYYFYFKASSWTQFCDFPWNKKHVQWKYKRFIYLSQHDWKWIKIEEFKMLIFSTFYEKGVGNKPSIASFQSNIQLMCNR